MFSKVKPGNPWWYWFDNENEEIVLRVVRDGSGGLWVHFKGHGVSLKEFEEHSPCLGPVAPRVVKAIKKLAKVHLNNGGFPLCDGDRRLRGDSKQRHFELTMDFKEITCRKCIYMVNKTERLLGFKKD